MRALDRFQKLALLTTGATYSLIAIGGLVRAAGAGLGCPDWPRCYGRWIPPLDASSLPPDVAATFNVAKAWTEYFNRLAGVVVGLLIFATLVYAIRRYRSAPRVLVPTILAFVLVGIEGWIGGKVVASKLAPIVLTVHLTFALVIVSLLLYATVSAFFPAGKKIPESRKLLARLSLGVSIIVLAQIGLGAAVRGELQLIAKEASLPREEWITAAGAIYGLHKSFAMIAAFAVVLLVWYVHARAERDVWLRGVATTSLVFVVLQAAAGFCLATYSLPPVLQVAHLWIGALLLGALMVLCLLAYRLDPREASVVVDTGAQAVIPPG